MNAAMPNLDAWPTLIEPLTPFSEGAWDRYVAAHPEGSFFHRAAWQRVLAKGAGFNTHFLIARRCGLVVGVLPLAQVKSLLFGHALVSLPFCVQGGVLADDDGVAAQLMQAAAQRREDLRADYLELRHSAPQTADWPRREPAWALFKRDLEPDAERSLLAIPRKQRAVIRKALGGSLECREETTLDNFLVLYATSVRNLGTPVFPTRYFKALYEAFAKDSWITTVYADGQPVSSVWSFVYKNTVMPYYAGALPAARELKAFDFMYWDLMRRACEAGLGSFDFGRSRYGTGAFSFKKNWGFEPAPVHYEYHLPAGRALPGHNPDSRVFQMASSVWRRLPLPMANWLGPMVSPYLA